MVENNKFHISFKLNNTSFSSVDELLEYSYNLPNSISQFLENWFSDQDFIVVKTSGSTGKPKSISLQKKQMMNSALATGNFFDVKENTKALLCLPVDYIAGKMMLVRALTLGWVLDIIKADTNPLKNVSNQYDFSAMVPLQVENSIHKLDKVKTLIIGGGVVSNVLHNKLQFVNTDAYATYGMTETITHIAVKRLNKCTSLRERMTKQSVIQNETALFNETKNNKIASIKNTRKDEFYEVLPNVTIYKDVRNCLVINAPKVSNEIIFTNDVVNLISDTQFEWLGRFDNVINSGGIKLHPEKIEEKLGKIISKRFFVAGITDSKFGQKLILVVEGNKTEINIDDACLSKYEKPKQIYFIKRFIETETKKIQRKKTLDLIEE